MLKCIVSTTIPQAWVMPLAYDDVTGLEATDEKELEKWLDDNGLTGAEVFDFGTEDSGLIRCAVYVDLTDTRPEVSKYLDEYDCEDWLNLRIAADYPARWDSAAELARELIEDASDLDKPFLQAVIDSETEEA